MTTLITGASGFLGGALARALAAEGPVLATGRDDRRCTALAADLGSAVLRLDLAGPDAVAQLAAAAQAAGVRRIIHAAALTAPWGTRSAFFRANVTATQTVLEAARRCGVVRIVMISSPSVYFRHADQFLLPEDAPLPRPVNAYTATKRQAEALARDYGAIVLRPRGIYGPGDRALMPRLVRAMRAGPLPLMRDGRAETDLTHVDDVISAVRAALVAQGLAGRVFNISGGVGLPLREVVEAVGARIGIRPRWRALPVPVVMAAATLSEARAILTGQEPRLTRYGAGLFAHSQTLDLRAAAQALGWQPRVSFAEGLARTFSAGVACS